MEAASQGSTHSLVEESTPPKAGWVLEMDQPTGRQQQGSSSFSDLRTVERLFESGAAKGSCGCPPHSCTQVGIFGRVDEFKRELDRVASLMDTDDESAMQELVQGEGMVFE